MEPRGKTRPGQMAITWRVRGLLVSRLTMGILGVTIWVMGGH